MTLNRVILVLLMTLNRVKLERAVVFMKCLTTAVSLIFLPKTLIWNKITFRLLNLLSLAELMVNEVTKSVSKKNYQYSFSYQTNHYLLQRLQELITKEPDNFSKILISIVFYWSWTTRARALGMRRVVIKIFEKDQKQKFPLKFKWFFYRFLIDTSLKWASKQNFIYKLSSDDKTLAPLIAKTSHTFTFLSHFREANDE